VNVVKAILTKDNVEMLAKFLFAGLLQ